MFFHTKQFQYYAKPDAPDPIFAKLMQELLGGQWGEISVMMSYLLDCELAEVARVGGWDTQGDALIDVAYLDLNFHTSSGVNVPGHFPKGAKRENCNGPGCGSGECVATAPEGEMRPECAGAGRHRVETRTGRATSSGWIAPAGAVDHGADGH